MNILFTVESMIDYKIAILIESNLIMSSTDERNNKRALMTTQLLKQSFIYENV